MTPEEYKKCEWAANMYHDKARECEVLKMQLEQKIRENKLLKERLGYKTAIDIQHSKEDAEVFALVRSHTVIIM